MAHTWNFIHFIQTWLKASLDHIRPCPKEGERRWGYIAQWKSPSYWYWHVWGPGFDPGLEAEGLLTELVAVWLYMSDIFAVISIFLWLSRWPETIEKKLVCSPFLCVCVQFTYHKIFTRFKYASHWFWSNLQPFLCNSNLSFYHSKKKPSNCLYPHFLFSLVNRQSFCLSWTFHKESCNTWPCVSSFISMNGCFEDSLM